MLYVGCFAFSLGPIVWLLHLGDLPAASARARHVDLDASNWVGNFLVSQFFLTMVERLGRSGTFAIYAALCIVTILFVRAMVPETKQELLERIRVRA